MLDHEMRRTIILLHEKGMSKREMMRRLNISRNTVRAVIRNGMDYKPAVRSDKIVLAPKRLSQLHSDCQGWVERVHECLTTEGIKIGYSTLTKMVRQMMAEEKDVRCDKVEDVPGKEMQNDTSPYRIDIAGEMTKVIACLLYFRYSKHRYLKFYRFFTRFKMKCFFAEALSFFQNVAPICIIDNTNLAVAGGSGPDALIHAEMRLFAELFCFRFVPHHLKHSNRKAGNERAFWTVETNFFPGRTFQSFEDLNAQAFDWSTNIFAKREVTKKRIIPISAFEEEKPYLRKLPPYLPRPYLVHERDTDQYGYAAFMGNFFWVPGKGRYPVKVVEYADSVKIFHNHKELIEYRLPADCAKNERIKPEGIPSVKEYARGPKKLTHNEEGELRSLDETANTYIDFALSRVGQRHQFLRRLYTIFRRTPKTVFIDSLQRALRYRIADMETIERIIVHNVRAQDLSLPEPEINRDYELRPTYLEGRDSEAPDLSRYDQPAKEI